MSQEPVNTFGRLLISQVALILVYPLLGEYWSINFLLGAFLVLALYGGISVTLSKPSEMWIAIALGLIFVGSYWLGEALEHHGFRVWGRLWGTAFFWFVAVIMTRHVFFKQSRVDTDLIFGAVSIYLLIGSGFGELFGALAVADPGSFNGVDFDGDNDKLARSMSYFSFVTLTTLGYGDITPAVYHVKVVAYVEAIVGQLYLAILVARLVGTYIAQSHNE